MAIYERPKCFTDVVIKHIQAIDAEVIVPDEKALAIGTLLITKDGGDSFSPLEELEEFSQKVYALDDRVYHNGHIYKSLNDINSADISDDSNWYDEGLVDVNGVLCDYITQSQTANVLISGSVKQSNLSNYKEMFKPQLFKNKILVK